MRRIHLAGLSVLALVASTAANAQPAGTATPL